MDHQYGFGGKEEQNEFNGALGWHDFGARNYDPALGRWMNPDPLAELDYNWTPFRYGYNNPILYTDPDGLWEFRINGNADDGFYVTLDAEEGDNLESLAAATGFSIEELSELYDEKTIEGLKEGTVTSLDSFGGYIKGMNAALNEENIDGCNCWGSSIDFSLSKEVNPKGDIPSPHTADRKLNRKFEETNTPKTGDIIRYAREDGYDSVDLNGDGKIDEVDKSIVDFQRLPNSGGRFGGTSHYANFLLVNKSGETQVFSKNGKGVKWQILTDRQIRTQTPYGKQTGINGGSTTYAPKVKKKKSN